MIEIRILIALGIRRQITGKRLEGTFWDEKNILSVDWNDDYIPLSKLITLYTLHLCTSLVID